ncbi:glycine-rich cell wall structural protein 1.8-like [Cryptomeria japonica]|uniref:glycine-rich cell wall structural protein 1.8-like n=1 Tax=Cryptomeria japonica TaxID=3369 RepID=UPI0027DA87E5|nr:glycine-rich cell wall structural protein 1.8-like [Cryptomeria japonica]
MTSGGFRRGQREADGGGAGPGDGGRREASGGGAGERLVATEQGREVGAIGQSAGGGPGGSDEQRAEGRGAEFDREPEAGGPTGAKRRGRGQKARSDGGAGPEV